TSTKETRKNRSLFCLYKENYVQYSHATEWISGDGCGRLGQDCFWKNACRKTQLGFFRCGRLSSLGEYCQNGGGDSSERFRSHPVAGYIGQVAWYHIDGGTSSGVGLFGVERGLSNAIAGWAEPHCHYLPQREL